jgi:ketosteroid isomerase-like protein
MTMSDEAAIRALLNERAHSTHDKDADQVLRWYSPDIVNFDLAPPLAQRGREATDPAVLQSWFDTWDGLIGITFEPAAVRTTGDLAFTFGFLHLTGKRTDGSHTDVWARFTICLERHAGAWRIVHEHQSFPTRMDGSEKSVSDLKP